MINSNVPIIDLKHVAKSFGEREVLKDVNLCVNNGEMVSIMGKSGSGKSTLLNILAYFENQSKGIYLFNGKKAITENQKSEIRNRYMGFVFQSYNLIPQLTVYENITLPIFYSIDKSKRKNRLDAIDELIEKYGLTSIKNSYVENISGGEKQRVCMARANVCEANLIISDEPTGNLDDKNKQIVLDGFKGMNKAGKTIIIVTHDNEVESIATRKLHLMEGVLQ